MLIQAATHKPILHQLTPLIVLKHLESDCPDAPLEG